MDTLKDKLDNMLKTFFAKGLYHVLRIILIGVFLWSGITKALHPLQFAEIVAAYGLLPEALALLAAISLIALEIIAAIGLLFEKRGALAWISLMMILFLAVLSYGIYLGLDIDCGCFGPNDPEAVAFHDLRGAFQRDLLLILAIGYLYLWRFINHLTPYPWLNSNQSQAIPKEI